MERHAYLIMAHSEYAQLKMLIEMLDYPGNDIFVHIDQKSPAVEVDYFRKNIKYSKVFLYREYPVYWGHYSVTACEVLLLEKALQVGAYEYLHLMSGEDLPLCGQGKIHRYFEANRGKEFVRYWAASFPEQHKAWVKYYHPLQKYLRLSKSRAVNRLFAGMERGIEKLEQWVGINRLRNADFELQKGATWFSITGEFAAYIVSQKDWIKRNFVSTRNSDEVFVQTLLHNSAFEARRFESTYETDGLTGPRYIDWTRGNPYVFRSENFQELNDCGCLFARKFSITTDRDIVTKLYDRVMAENQAELEGKE